MIVNIITIITTEVECPKEDHIEVIIIPEVLEANHTEVEGKGTLITNRIINIHNRLTLIIMGT